MKINFFKILATFLISLTYWTGNSQTWQTVGQGIGMDNSVRALLSDTTSNTLIAAGQFTVADVISSQNMISWDGNGFNKMSLTPNSSPLCMVKDSVNNLLYVTGNFTSIGSNTISGTAVWNGTTWSQCGYAANSMCMYNGELHLATFSGVKKWNGSSYVNVGLNGPTGSIKDLVVFQGSLYACGNFNFTPNSTPAIGIAKFDGNDWSSVGYTFSSGTSYGVDLVASDTILFYHATDNNKISMFDGSTWSQIASNAIGVNAMKIYNRELYLGGSFSSIEGVAANKIAKWDGLNWSAVGTGISNAAGMSVNDLYVYNGELYVGGFFNTAGGISANNIAKWNGVNWSSLSVGLASSNGSGVKCFADFNCELMIGGYISGTKGTTVNRVAEFNGYNWSSLGGGAGFIALSLAKWNNDIYVGGFYSTIGNISTHNIAKWNGTTYSDLDGGTDGNVTAMAVYNGELYVGGAFQNAGSVNSPYIAKWNGFVWDTVGAGLNDAVYALAVYNGELYAGGVFSASGAQTMNNIAKWDGTSWIPVGSGTDGDVLSLCVHNNKLYAGGNFMVPGSNIASWDGTSWTTLGTGINNDVMALSSFNGDLYAGGIFTNAGGNPLCKRIARWNGTSWLPLASGMNNGNVRVIASHNNNLYAGGDFTQAAPNQMRSYIAKWETAQVPIADFNNCDGDICSNGCLVFNDISSNNPTTFQWTFPGGTPSSSSLANPRVCYNAAGTYSVKLVVSNTAGSDTSIQSVTIFPSPAIPVITFSGIGVSLLSSSAIGNQWYLNGYPIVGAIYQAYMPTLYGYYSVSVSDSNSCMSMSQPLNYGLATSLNETTRLFNFSIVPVPSSDKITVNAGPFSERISKLIIRDALGKEILSREFDSVKSLLIDIPISEMATGVYFVFIKDGPNECVKKFIKN